MGSNAYKGCTEPQLYFSSRANWDGTVVSSLFWIISELKIKGKLKFDFDQIVDIFEDDYF